jgi:hypothetical protein
MLYRRWSIRAPSQHSCKINQIRMRPAKRLLKNLNKRCLTPSTYPNVIKIDMVCRRSRTTIKGTSWTAGKLTPCGRGRPQDFKHTGLLNILLVLPIRKPTAAGCRPSRTCSSDTRLPATRVSNSRACVTYPLFIHLSYIHELAFGAIVPTCWDVRYQLGDTCF